MICYRDMTFCNFWWDCEEGLNCDRALTPKVRVKAEEFGLPICQFVDKPDCWIKMKIEEMQDEGNK